MVRSSCVPPRATNAHSRIANATPPRIVGAAGGSGTSIAGTSARRACRGTYALRSDREPRPRLRIRGAATSANAAAAIRASTPMSVPGSALRPTSARQAVRAGRDLLDVVGEFGSHALLRLGDRGPLLRRAGHLAAGVGRRRGSAVGVALGVPALGSLLAAGAAAGAGRRCRRRRRCRTSRRRTSSLFGLAVFAAIARVSTSRQSRVLVELGRHVVAGGAHRRGGVVALEDAVVAAVAQDLLRALRVSGRRDEEQHRREQGP